MPKSGTEGSTKSPWSNAPGRAGSVTKWAQVFTGDRLQLVARDGFPTRPGSLDCLCTEYLICYRFGMSRVRPSLEQGAWALNRCRDVADRLQQVPHRSTGHLDTLTRLTRVGNCTCASASGATSRLHVGVDHIAARPSSAECIFKENIVQFNTCERPSTKPPLPEPKH